MTRTLFGAAAVVVIGFAVACGLGCQAVNTDDGGISNAVPAPCSSNEDCGEGVDCLFLNDTDEAGLCDVTEMVAP